MASSAYWWRYYKLTIIPPSGNKMTFETGNGKASMDIKFDVTYARGQVAREGTVSILGLGYDTIHDILELAALPRGGAMSKMSKLTLEAGYYSVAGAVEVLNGFIWYGTVTSPPEMWLNLKVSEVNLLSGKAIPITQDKEVPIAEFLYEVCTQFSEAEKVEFAYYDNTAGQTFEDSDEMVKFDSHGAITLHDLIQKLNKQLSHNYQFTLRTFASDETRIIEVFDKENYLVTDGDVVVDKDHGLLSVTGIDCISGCVTTFIDGRMDDELCHLQLTSELNPHANGRYYIMRKQYVGHYLGPEWYVRYYCSAKEGQEDMDEQDEDEE